MRCQASRLKTVVGLFVAMGLSGTVLWSQQPPQPPPAVVHAPSPFLAPADQVVAIRAGRLFDAKAGGMLTNQVVLIRGDRIADVGPGVQIPPGARVIDLGRATVLPGMIDVHVHIIGPAGQSLPARTLTAVEVARKGLYNGFTTLVDLNNRDNYATVDVRNAINAGLVQGPRLQVSGPAVNPRAGAPVAAPSDPWDHGIDPYDVTGPWLARKAVRERKWYGTDWIKIYGTMDFLGAEHRVFRPDNTMINSPSLTFEEIQAIVDEAHRLGLKVACHAYGGEGLRSCINAGVDLPMHGPELEDASVKVLVQKKLPMMYTIEDLVGLNAGDKLITGGKTSRLDLTVMAFKKTLSAGVPAPFGSGATSGGQFPVGLQARQFEYLVKWGMTPAQALQTAMTVAASALNYGWADRVGTLEKGKFADIIGVSGDPLADVKEMERIKFVMKGGVVVRNDLSSTPSTTSTASR